MQKYAEAESNANLHCRGVNRINGRQAKNTKNGGSDEYQGEFSILYEILI